MSEYRASLAWRRTSSDYTYESYNRSHEIRSGSGIAIAASGAAEFKGDADRMNPEEAFVAALSSCHMLTFLAVAARRHLSLDSYEDDAVGFMEKNAQGKRSITRAILRPKVVWSEGVSVTPEDLETLHRFAHSDCFIANSVKTEVVVEPRS